MTKTILTQDNKSKKYGVHNNPIYCVWSTMIQRCTNPNNKKYKEYGGRGIDVCQEWRESFKAFHSDMGDRPSGKTIDRIDNSKGYSPDNCRWATHTEQARNRRGNRILTFNGKTQSLAAWADEVDIKYMTIKSRLLYGWSVEKALSTKVTCR